MAMRELEMQNGQVTDAADEWVPWCPVCETYTAEGFGVCTDCGTVVILTQAGQ